jgi:YHS domain-containing protein
MPARCPSATRPFLQVLGKSVYSVPSVHGRDLQHQFIAKQNVQTMKHFPKLISVLFLPVVFFTTAIAQQTPEVRKKEYNLGKGGLAIQGYDPVAYFTSHKAVEGKKEINLLHNGVTYRFATAQNRDAFKTAPAKYEPQYGGWCAYAMGAKGEKVEIDPETFKIVDGKLFHFYNKLFNNTLTSWNKNEAQLKKNADQQWTKFVQ